MNESETVLITFKSSIWIDTSNTNNTILCLFLLLKWNDFVTLNLSQAADSSGAKTGPQVRIEKLS